MNMCTIHTCKWENKIRLLYLTVPKKNIDTKTDTAKKVYHKV